MRLLHGARVRLRARRRDRRMRHAPRGLAALRRGRSDRACDRARRRARRDRAGRAARGPGRLAQRRLDARRRGDRVLAAEGDGMTEEAFAQLVADHRGELRAHCYRMLGSLHDAEDALQETLLRAWRANDSFEGRSSLRSWLYTIATNVCLRAIERRPKRVLPIDYGPASADPHADTGEPITESVWIEPFPGPDVRYEQRESVELAFIAALQHLPAQQRAVLILRDVLGYSGAEAAAALDTNADAVYSALQRAHKTVQERLPEQTQQATLRSLGDERLSEIVTGYVDAWERNDVDALAALLAED